METDGEDAFRQVLAFGDAGVVLFQRGKGGFPTALGNVGLEKGKNESLAFSAV